jgi:malate/lactate dehydrogenase
MRVTIFGASGKVGKEAIKNLILMNAAEDLELVLIARNTDRIKGMVADIESAAPLLPWQPVERHAPRITVTSDARDIAGTDLAVITAGAWPTPEQKEAFAKTDPSGRLVQSRANFDLVQDISRQIARYAPGALTLVVTNQSDMMAEAAREMLAPEKVLGFGGIVDSARLRAVIRAKMPGMEFGLHMIGYHNADMIVADYPVPDMIYNSNFLRKAEAETRAYGGHVSKLQKDFNYPHIDSGASVLPGYALYTTIAAFTGQTVNPRAELTDIEESFNVRLPREISVCYGTRENGALSVPVVIGKGGYKVSGLAVAGVTQLPHLRAAQERMEASYAELKAALKGPVSAATAPAPR